MRYCVEQDIQNAVQSSYVQRCYFSSKIATKPSGRIPANGPGLKEFIIAGKNSLVAQNNPVTPDNVVPYLNEIDYNGRGRKVFFEVYGCQMNVNDTEIVWSILKDNGYEKADSADQADVVLLMTCAIREKAESKVCWLHNNRDASFSFGPFCFRFGIGCGSWPLRREYAAPSAKFIKSEYWAAWPSV